MDNFTRIKAAVASSNFGAIMITSPANRLFASGFQSTAGIAVVTAKEAWFFTDSRYIEAAAASISNAVVLPVDNNENYSDRINTILSSRSINMLGFEDEQVTFSDYEVWRRKLRAKLVPAQDLLTSLRAVKSREDLEAMIRAQRIAEKSFEEILPVISTDLTEKELAAELMCRFFRNGAEDKSFDTIVVSGERSSMPHGMPTDRKISKGFLTMDFGVKAGGWCSDTTRTVCIGEPTQEMRRVYDTVLAAQKAGIAAAHAGVRGSEIHNAAAKVIADAGYGAYFVHAFGHSLGLEIHEAPNASPSNGEPIPEGAVISAEPGIYLPGRFGVRIEDVLYITANGNFNLTNLPKKLIIL